MWKSDRLVCDVALKTPSLPSPAVVGTVKKLSQHEVIVAEMKGASIGELVLIGDQNVYGEVVQHMTAADFFVYTYPLENDQVKERMKIRLTGRPVFVEFPPLCRSVILDELARPMVGAAERRWNEDYGQSYYRQTKLVTKLWDKLITEPFDKPNLKLSKPMLKSGSHLFDYVRNKSDIGGFSDRKCQHIYFPPIEAESISVEAINLQKLRTKYVFTPEEMIGIKLRVKQKGEKNFTEYNMPYARRWPLRKPWPFHSTAKSAQKRVIHVGTLALDILLPLEEGGTALLKGDSLEIETTIIQRILEIEPTAIDSVVVDFSEMALKMPFIKLIEKVAKNRTIISPDPLYSTSMETAFETAIRLANDMQHRGKTVFLIIRGIDKWAQAVLKVSEVLGKNPKERLHSMLTSIWNSLGRKLVSRGEKKNVNSSLSAIVIHSPEIKKHPILNEFLTKKTTTVWKLKRTKGSGFEIDFNKSRCSPIEKLYVQSDYKKDWIFIKNFHDRCIAAKTRNVGLAEATVEDRNLLCIKVWLDNATNLDDINHTKPYYLALWWLFIQRIAETIRVHEEYLSSGITAERKAEIKQLLTNRKVWDRINEIRLRTPKPFEGDNIYGVDFVYAHTYLDNLFEDEKEEESV